MTVFIGHLHHAGSIDAESAPQAIWWPKTSKDAVALWDAFQARYCELVEKARAIRLEAKERGEAPPSIEGLKPTAADRTVMQALIFTFGSRRTGQLDPSQVTIAKATGLHRATVARALQRLLRFGFITWERRRTVMRKAGAWWYGQTSNLYRFIKQAMSQKAGGTESHIYSDRVIDLSTGRDWTSRLAFAVRQRENEERKRQATIQQARLKQPFWF